MPRIKMTNGYFHYNTVPIFEGIKRIDKEKAFENLLLLKEILDKNGIVFQLTFGTLLGAIREHDFIDHDEDIDLLLWGEDKQRCFDLLPVLAAKGFGVARYDRRDLLSIIRDGEYIDFYFFSPRGDNSRYCSGIILPTELTDETIEYKFRGVFFRIPKEYSDFLRYEYGDDWMTPTQWFNYELSYLLRLSIVIKSFLKELLPDKLFFYLVKQSEKRMLDRYAPKLARFRMEQLEKQLHT